MSRQEGLSSSNSFRDREAGRIQRGGRSSLLAASAAAESVAAPTQTPYTGSSGSISIQLPVNPYQSVTVPSIPITGNGLISPTAGAPTDVNRDQLLETGTVRMHVRADEKEERLIRERASPRVPPTKSSACSSATAAPFTQSSSASSSHARRPVSPKQGPPLRATRPITGPNAPVVPHLNIPLTAKHAPDAELSGHSRSRTAAEGPEQRNTQELGVAASQATSAASATTVPVARTDLSGTDVRTGTDTEHLLELGAARSDEGSGASSTTGRTSMQPRCLQSVFDGSSMRRRWEYFKELCERPFRSDWPDQLLLVGTHFISYWATLPNEVIGVFALLPILDPILDLIVANQLFSNAHYGAAITLLFSLLVNWRCCIVYAALTPTVTLHSMATIYLPFAVLPWWSQVMGEEVGEKELELVYSEAGVTSPAKQPPSASGPRLLGLPKVSAAPLDPSPPASPPSPMKAHFTRLSLRNGRPVRQSAPVESRSTPRYGTEAARVRVFMERHHDEYQTKQGWMPRLIFLTSFEAKLTGLAVILGPFLLWRAALTIAHGLALPVASLDSPRYFDPKMAEAAQRQLLYSRVLTFVEALAEGIPQLALQSGFFYFFHHGVDSSVYAFSAACSLGVIATALITFAQHRNEILNLLDPPRSAFAAQVSAVCNSARGVDPAALLAAILAARAAGVQSEELKKAILRMKDARVTHARSGSSATELKEAGILTSELFDAGFSAAQLKAEGYSLEELESVGYSLRDLRAADYTVFELHANGHTLAELKAVGFSAEELKELNVYTPMQLREAGFSAVELKAVMYSPADLHQAGFSLKELKEALFSLVDLKAAGFSTTSLKTVGFTAAELQATQCSASELKQAGFTLPELHALEYTLKSLSAAGFSPQELKGVGYAAAEMKHEGYSALSLKGAGYTVMELRASGYPTLELKDAGFTVAQLTHAGCGAPEMRAGGFSVPELKSVYTPAELRAAGFSAEEMRTGGITSVAILKAAGYTAGEMKAAGYNAAQTKAAGFVLAELKVAGYSAKQMKPAGYALGEMKAVGCSPTELREAGFTAAQLRAARFSAAEQKVAGYTARDLKDAGYAAAELKAAGYSAAELKTAGYTTAELRAALYTAVQLKAAGYSAPQMKDAGFSLKQLKTAGYVLAELKTARFTAAELKASGYSMEELKSAGYLAAEMKLALYTANQLTCAGYTLSELKVAGYDAMELKVSGYSAAALTVAGYSVTQLKQSGYLATDCKAAGYSAAELRSAGFTLQQLKAAEYTHQELMTAGFSTAALRVLQNTLAVAPSNATPTRREHASSPSRAIIPTYDGHSA